jgi:BirA family biotin operon repressor/biotin-[acetyl-CoA-carboxylase] ligase
MLPPEELELFRALGGGPDIYASDRPDMPFWERLHLIEEAAGSQFDTLRAREREGRPVPAPLLTVAMAGRGFHGHRARDWATLPGNVHLCAVFRPVARPVEDALGMVMLPALATVDAVRQLSGRRLAPGIKWVNDVLVLGRKVAGVLTATSSREERLVSVVLGIGLNVERRPEVPPTPFVPAVACLRDFPGGEGLRCDAAIEALAAALGRRAERVAAHGPASLYAEYRESSLVRGRHARVLSEEGELLAEGIVEDVLPDLRLRFAGRGEPVDRGRLVLV